MSSAFVMLTVRCYACGKEFTAEVFPGSQSVQCPRKDCLAFNDRRAAAASGRILKGADNGQPD